MQENAPLSREALTRDDRPATARSTLGLRIEEFWRQHRPAETARLEAEGTFAERILEEEAAYLSRHEELRLAKMDSGTPPAMADLEATEAIFDELRRTSERDPEA